VTPDQSWFPPTSLTGRHWRVEILHVNGQWAWYTEHITERQAEVMLSYKRELSPLDQWRVVEAHR
jgi:hypothetical protein